MKTKNIFFIILAILMASGLQGQKSSKKITISGYVVDSCQYPVPQAIILIDGVKTIYVTDTRGYFKVRVQSSAEKIGILSLSSGSITEELINGRTRINFVIPGPVSSIAPATNDAGEDVVNTGYGYVRKKNLTQPVNKIEYSGKNYVNYSTIYEMIAGRVPGVEVRGKSILIQGTNTFFGSSEPLYVVDGMVVPSIDDISPQEVSSIEVLKGSSAAIYGSRGANGVILISLKKAKDHQK
jgi:TonB-dependent SusC/RagA subfamily outer membrane receptor